MLGDTKNLLFRCTIVVSEKYNIKRSSGDHVVFDNVVEREREREEINGIF